MEIQSQHSNIQKLLVSACDKYYYEIKCVYQVPRSEERRVGKECSS